MDPTDSCSGTRPAAPETGDALGMLRATAVQEITSHTASSEFCRACGAVWPCGQAVLAEHNLALL